MESTITINKNNSRFEDIQFVSRAIDKKHIRPFCTLIRSDNGVIVATDTRRLHFIFDDEDVIPDGYYSVIKNTKSEIILKKENDLESYPNIWDVIPYEPVASVKVNPIGIGATSKITHILPYNVGVNPEFIKDLGDDIFTVYHSDSPMSPIAFSNHSKFAVIMPIKIDIPEDYD